MIWNHSQLIIEVKHELASFCFADFFFNVLLYSETSDTPKEDKPPNKGQAKSTLLYTLYRKSPLKEDNLSIKDKTAGPEGVLIEMFHCKLH